VLLLGPGFLEQLSCRPARPEFIHKLFQEAAAYSAEYSQTIYGMMPMVKTVYGRMTMMRHFMA
jgi:hypothetical protein